jgi:hypothetical protein
MHRALLALAFAVALTLVLAAAGSARPAAQVAPAVFTDPAGDSGTAADLTSVSATNNAQAFTFDVGFAAPLVPTSIIDIYVDSDLNGSTGDPQALGADYLVEDVEADHTFGFYKWDGTKWSFVSTTTVAVSASSDQKSLTIDVGLGDLAGSKGFNFFVVSVDGDGTAGHLDDAPSGSGSWQYTYQSPLKLSLAGVKTFVAKAGGKWFVALVARRSDTGATLGAEGTVVCNATSGSTKLTVIDRAFVSAGSGKGSAAVCEFIVPKKLKHKLLQGTIGVAFEGESLKHSFSQRVK